MPETPADPSRVRRSRARAQKIAWLLDGALRLPGTKFRFGLDSIIGLIPGVGDVIGLLLGATLLYEAVRVGAPRALLAKMVGNAATDALGGLVPGIGDLFDFAFRSNRRNANLLLEHLDRIEAQPASAGRGGSRLLAMLLISVFLLAAVALLAWVWSLWLGRSNG